MDLIVLLILPDDWWNQLEQPQNGAFPAAFLTVVGDRWQWLVAAQVVPFNEHNFGL